MSDGQFNEIDGQVFSLDRDVDCFYTGGYMIIRNVPSFERIFGFFTAMSNRAAQVFDEFVVQLPISNMDEFRDACMGDSRMTRKLASIARRPYINDLTPRDIRDAAEEMGIGVLTSTGPDGQLQLTFERSPQQRFKILKLLDDDFLMSALSSEKYEVNSKPRFGA